MRLLFISGTASGGAAISTQELASRLATRGHTVGVLMRTRLGPADRDHDGPGWRPGHVMPRAWRVADRVLVRRARGPVAAENCELWTARHVEAVLPHLIRRFTPDVLVVNSVHERAWRAIRHRAARSDLSTVLYLRESSALRHLVNGHVPDLILANAHSHATEVAELGLHAVVVPSIVELDRVAVDTTGATKVLYVNPIPSRGLETAIAVARLCPHLPFAFQESHRLSHHEWQLLHHELEGVSNVELRPYTDDRPSVYRDAAVLLVPYLSDNRPRVVVEAQANGIPVVAADRPGLDEAVDSGGVLVPPGSSPEQWATVLTELVESPTRHARLAAAGRECARHSAIDPERLCVQFEAAVQGLVDGG